MLSVEWRPIQTATIAAEATTAAASHVLLARAGQRRAEAHEHGKHHDDHDAGEEDVEVAHVPRGDALASPRAVVVVADAAHVAVLAVLR